MSTPIRILVAEDHLVARVGVTTIVNMQPDMTVVAEASNGQQAVEAYRQFQPDVTLLDLRMPGVDGFEVLKQVRHEPRLKNLPITVFTGSNDPEHFARARELGANSVVVKPFKIDRFFEAVKTIADFWLNYCKLPQTQPA